MPRERLVGEVLLELRQSGRKPHTIAYVYVVEGEENTLVGVVDLRELVLAADGTTLGDAMTSPVASAGDEDVGSGHASRQDDPHDAYRALLAAHLPAALAGPAGGAVRVLPLRRARRCGGCPGDPVHRVSLRNMRTGARLSRRCMVPKSHAMGLPKSRILARS